MNESLDYIIFVNKGKNSCIFCKNEIKDKKEHIKECKEYKNHSIKDRKYFFMI